MVIKPKILRNICLTAHPEGCRRQVLEQVNFIKEKGRLTGPKNILIIGASNGFGLAARIVGAFGYGAATIGVYYEKAPSGKKSGTAGWYNDEALRDFTKKDALDAWSVNGDAFSEEVKEQVVEIIKNSGKVIDLIIYSIAAPRRIDPVSGEIYSSVIKPVGKSYESKILDFNTGQISDRVVEPATEEEVHQTVKVMGGEDWRLWTERLKAAGVLDRGVKTIAFSYIGPGITAPIYRDGSIGEAKKDLEATVPLINETLKSLEGQGIVSVNKALVTRASAVIPGVSLYISLLYRVMKKKGLHEVCIHQMERLFREYLYTPEPAPTDERGFIRLDDYEMRPDVQEEVTELWKQITTENLETLSDIKIFRDEYLKHHGFGIKGIDYTK